MFKISEEKCPQNHKCPLVFGCPVNAISQEGFSLPHIDSEKCIKCGKCYTACALGAVEIIDEPLKF